ncbi:hypothetical protein NOS3756_33830 [Nostoc sp. NIES-3756]|uniref:hypothetical protein n=1 Tax=Nostoc sp. NIES-3756 TaxID=1751286 RepID=UPI00071F8397|nr:hypothetical protein [Nostoc sp. NIES-3756]BAT54414.1 hypothetical protein NOS3756_33830 [Nostoc sp. NIES-3756]
MDYYTELVSLANQANIDITNRNYQNAVDAYTNALKIARELERYRCTRRFT